MRIFKRAGSPYWWLTYNAHGRRVRESTHCTRKADAEIFLGKRQVELFEGKHFPEKRRTGLTVEEMRVLWFATKGRDKKSRIDDEHRFKVIVEHFGVGRQVAAIKPADVEAFTVALQGMSSKRATPFAPATVNHHLKLLRAAMNNAAANDYDVGNARTRVRLLRLHNERDRICTEAEFRRIIEHAHPKLRFATIMAYYTAMRMGEIANLTWEQVDLPNKLLKLRSEQTKTGSGRSIPLRPEAIEALHELPRSLAGGRIIDVDHNSLSPAFRRLCDKLGYHDLRFHDLRHTAITGMRRGGADIFTIAAISGHRDLQSLRRYNTVSDDDKHLAIQKLAGAGSRK